MKVTPIRQYPNTNFRSLIIENNQYTPEQQKTISDIKEKLNETNPYDKQGRSYLRYLEEKYNKDLLIRSSYEQDKVELNLVENNVEELIGNFSTTEPIGLSDLDYCTELAFLEKREFKSKLLNILILGTVIVSGMFLASRSKNTNNVIKTINKEIITSKPSTLPADTLNVSKNLIK